MIGVESGTRMRMCHVFRPQWVSSVVGDCSLFSIYVGPTQGGMGTAL